MDAAAFEGRLKSEGYPEIRTNSLDGKARKYAVGDDFTMQAGCRHVEDAGPQGVRYLVGRRHK